jgi:hypothetical protein
MGIIRLINGFINSRLRVLTFERFGDLVKNDTGSIGGSPRADTPAHESLAAVAPFQVWPSSQVIVAGGP